METLLGLIAALIALLMKRILLASDK